MWAETRCPVVAGRPDWGVLWSPGRPAGRYALSQVQQFPLYPNDPIQPMSEDSFDVISRPMYRV
jgi:hypothetical protein